MSFEEFEKMIKELDEELYVVEESDLFLVYRKHAYGPEFVGSVPVIDTDDFEHRDLALALGLEWWLWS